MITALEVHADAWADMNRWRPFTCWGHVFPQASDCDRNATVRNATVYLPLESIAHGLRALETVANFTAMDSMTAVPSAEHKKNGTQYTQKVGLRSDPQGSRDIAYMPFRDIVALYGKGRSPPYRHFLANATLRERVRCLFANDLMLYAHACRQPLLRVPQCKGKCLPAHCDDPILNGF